MTPEQLRWLPHCGCSRVTSAGATRTTVLCVRVQPLGLLRYTDGKLGTAAVRTVAIADRVRKHCKFSNWRETQNALGPCLPWHGAEYRTD